MRLHGPHISRYQRSIVRTTRARIICLRNDYKSLMSRIEAGLHAHYASTAVLASSAASQTPSHTIATASYADMLNVPFAKVNGVVLGSPADEAGLKAGDAIRQFGNVHWRNHEKLSKIAETVQRSEGVSMD